MPEEKRPDVRPQLREFLAWHEEVLGRIESGAIVAPAENEPRMVAMPPLAAGGALPAMLPGGRLVRIVGSVEEADPQR